MGFLQRLFGLEKPPEAVAQAATSPTGEPIPPERVGLSGEFDQSGLAKRVAAAFDADPGLDDVIPFTLLRLAVRWCSKALFLAKRSSTKWLLLPRASVVLQE
jgi:hypothetical protein